MGAKHTHTHTDNERGQVRVSLLLLVFFRILTQILSVCPLLCSSHDNTCRRNSGRREKGEGGGAQGLKVEERAEGDGVEGESHRKRKREEEMEGGRAAVISESVPDSH